MRKKLFKTLTLCCIVAALSACNKDNSTEIHPNENTEQTRNAIEQLRSFRIQIEYVHANPGLKSEETLALSDALWDVENHFNLTYSDVEQYYNQINHHEFTLSIPIDEQQQVLVYDAVALYDQVTDQVRTALLSDEFENKGFISLTIKEVKQETRGTMVTFLGKTGNRTNYNPPIFHIDGPFDVDDNWIFAAPFGKCDDPDIPSGADEQLQEKLYAELIEPFIETSDSYRNIYIDRKRFVFDGSTYSGIYYNQNPENLCIEHEYMNDYYNGEKQVIKNIIPEQYHLLGYRPISIEINGIATEDGDAVTHYNAIEYGIQARVRIEEFGEVTSLVN